MEMYAAYRNRLSIMDVSAMTITPMAESGKRFGMNAKQDILGGRVK